MPFVVSFYIFAFEGRGTTLKNKIRFGDRFAAAVHDDAGYNNRRFKCHRGSPCPQRLSRNHRSTSGTASQQVGSWGWSAAVAVWTIGDITWRHQHHAAVRALSI